MKKITAFAGSNSSTSVNRQLVSHVISYFPEFEISLLDLNDYEMPLYSIDRQKNGFPGQAHRFLQEIAQADAIICSLAEHNHSYSVAFKNIFDWCSRIDRNVFGNKPMLLMSTGPGGFGGGNVLNAAQVYFPKCGADIIATFSLPLFNDNFIAGKINNETLRAELEEKIQLLKGKITLTS